MCVTETIFIFICKLLCIPLFKKIWIVNGSYWNKTHINKDNINDLKAVKKEAIYFLMSKILTQLFFNILFALLCIFNKKILKKWSSEIKDFIVGYNLVLIYPIMVHVYNIILAESRIQQLEDDYCRR